MIRYFIAQVEILDGEMGYTDKFLFTHEITISEDVMGIASAKANNLIDEWYTTNKEYRHFTLDDVTEITKAKYDVLNEFITAY